MIGISRRPESLAIINAAGKCRKEIGRSPETALLCDHCPLGLFYVVCRFAFEGERSEKACGPGRLRPGWLAAARGVDSADRWSRIPVFDRLFIGQHLGAGSRKHLPGIALAHGWPLPRGTHARRRRSSQPAECFLYRTGERRGVEVGRLRAHLESYLRP